MNLHVQVKYLKQLGHEDEVLQEMISYRGDEKFVDVSMNRFSEQQLDKLVTLTKKVEETWARALAPRIASYRNVHAAPEGKPIKKLELLAIALKAYIERAPNKWLFCDESDGFALPYYVESIKHEPTTQYHSAHVKVSLAAVMRRKGETKAVIFDRAHLGQTVVEILQKKGYYLETATAVATYRKDIELHKKWASKTGMQFSCVGTGYGMGESTTSFYVDSAMERDGEAAKVVLDDESDDAEGHGSGEDGEPTSPTAFWERNGSSKSSSDEEEGATSVATPVHPYVKVFDLRSHEFLLVHVRNLTPYVYDKTVAEKLVLNEKTKTLVTILVQGATDVLEDIIRGKTGGTIVIATGPPGTGKTLTAEVCAEEMERPLYVVQCSQLGTNEEKVEKQLIKVLMRASRWRAILLIDEADVYVHTRGTDLRQNAIVGVFLRVLEHYRGMLFLTSNRSTIIDDAILNRATAWLRYEMPEPNDLRQIWRVHSGQYGMPISDKTVEELLGDEMLGHISGRTVRNLFKLARLLRRGMKDTKPVDFALFKEVSAFLDIHKPEDAAS